MGLVIHGAIGAIIFDVFRDITIKIPPDNFYESLDIMEESITLRISYRFNF